MTNDPRRPWEANFIRSMELRRKAAGLTQTELAKRLRVAFDLPFHQQTIQRIESGERPVRLDEAHLIADELGAELSTMVSKASPDAEQMRFAVDQFRRTARNASAEIDEIMVDLVDRLESLQYAVFKQSGETDVPAQPVDPITRWGMGWAILGGRAIKELIETSSGLAELAGVDTDHLVYSFPSLDVLDAWQEIGLVDEIDPGDVTPNEFYAQLREDSDGEHPEA